MNTTDLIAALKIKGSFPSSNDLFSDADFLVLFNMAMHVEINPVMLQLNDEYLLQTKDFEIAPGKKYRIPRRTITLRDLKLVDGSGNVTDLNRNYEEDRASNRSGFYVTRNSIELSSDITSGTLRMSYFARPSKLILPTGAGVVESIDRENLQVTLATVPSSFANGVLIDVVQNQNPYDLLSLDVELVNLSGAVVTLPSVPDDLETGDWLTLANESPVPLAPEEMHTLLVQAALVTSLSSKKDKAYRDELEALNNMRGAIVSMLDPRVGNNSAKMRTGRLHSHFFGGRR